MENNSNSIVNNDAAEKSSQKKEGINTVMHSDITTNDEQQDLDLPGYPHYPASEDLLNPLNNQGRVDVDVENLTQSDKVSELNFNRETSLSTDSEVAQPALPDLKDDEEDLGIVPGTDADLTEDDLVILGSIDKDMDLGEDEDIESRAGWPLDVPGEDLDVPGAEIDDANEAIGEEDEENNYYSLGGDRRENLEDTV